MTKKRVLGGTLVPLSLAFALSAVSGCAGQLELPVEAYQAKSENGSGGAGGNGGITPSTVAPAPGGSVTVSAPGNGKTDAGTWADTGAAPSGGNTGGGNTGGGNSAMASDAWVAPADAGAPSGAGGAPAQPAPDAAAMAPPAPSACPPGVDALALMAQKCGSCHGERSPAKGLDLVSAGVGARMVGIKSTCQDKPLLDLPAPGAAGAATPVGHFLAKMQGPVPGCGAQMPYGTPALSQAEFDCLEEWSAAAIARAQKGR